MRANGCVRCVLCSAEGDFNTLTCLASKSEDLGTLASFSLSAVPSCRSLETFVSPRQSPAPHPKPEALSLSESFANLKTSAAAASSSTAAEQLPAVL